MRTLRLSLATMAILALLGGLGGTVVAQDEGENGLLTGTSTFIEDVTPPSVAEVGNVEQLRGASATYAFEMSDPRVTGMLTTLDLDMDVYRGTGMVYEGMAELANADGTWNGPWHGLYEDAMGWQMITSLDGDGAYDGLTFHVHMASPELADGVWELEGFIVEDASEPAE